MTSGKGRLLAGTAVPVAAGIALGAALGEAPTRTAVAAPLPVAPLPMAKKRAPGLHMVACNPCAPKTPCGPCAAKIPCNPCNPCAAANPCNPCNPCAGSGAAVSKSCFVPRLRAAWKANPCNPSSPCYAKAACSPCNPCAAKTPCNPCAAENPCAAANPCNPCSPCGAGAVAEITPEEAIAVYRCLRGEMVQAYERAGVADVAGYTQWTNVATAPYQSATHGSRYVNNYVDKIGAASYAEYEDVGAMPTGSVLAKDSFVVNPDGSVAIGPLFLMARVETGSLPATHDWRYQMIMPTGTLFGTTGGEGSGKVAFCAECHATVADAQDSLFFLPEAFRVAQ